MFAGKVGTGLDTRSLIELRGRLDALEIAKTPFTRAAASRAHRDRRAHALREAVARYRAVLPNVPEHPTPLEVPRPGPGDVPPKSTSTPESPTLECAESEVQGSD